MRTDDGEWRIPEAECFVYRIYDRAGALLYVGIATDMLARLGQHRRGPWWPTGATVRWTEHDSRDDASREEKRLIKRYRPPHNTLHKPRSWHVYLTSDTAHEPGCLDAMRESFKSPADRLAG